MTNQTTPLARLARNIEKAECLTNHLKHRHAIGDVIEITTIRRAEQTEINAHQAFAVACGHQPGSPGFTRALAEALADQAVETVQVPRRLLVETANAIACTLGTCAPVSMKPEKNPGKRSLYHLERCRDQIADLLDPSEGNRRAAC